MSSDAVSKFLNAAQDYVERLDIFDPYKLYRSEIYIGLPINTCSTRVSFSDTSVCIRDLSYIRREDGGIIYIDSSLRSSNLVLDFQLESVSSYSSWSDIISNFSARLELDGSEPPTIPDEVLQWEKCSGGVGDLKLADTNTISEGVTPKKAVDECIHKLLYEVLPNHGEQKSHPLLQKQIYNTDSIREIVENDLDSW
jgi:hypothetical protein